MMFSGKNILVGVSGGIAAYKAAELVRALLKRGAAVRVMMTEAAQKFITPLTFQTLCHQPVLTDLFPADGDGGTVHIDWARWPQLVVICPATANTIAKVAHGWADNALTTTLLATTAPVIFCPAMNKEMYLNRIYQDNQARLQQSGYRFVTPGQGELACGETGWGRLADVTEILAAIALALSPKKDFHGKRFLITAGPTYEPLDPVRFIGNRSSGKMGYALAERAMLRGGSVTLISGPSVEKAFPGVELIRVNTAAEMAQAVFDHLVDQDIFIMAAAVADYTPLHVAPHKLKKNATTFQLSLQRTQDILATCAAAKGDRIHVGFSLETEDEIENSIKKLRAKNLDFIVVNNPLQTGAGFAGDTNIVTIIDKNGASDRLPLMSKSEVADRILDKIAEIS